MLGHLLNPAVRAPALYRISSLFKRVSENAVVDWATTVASRPALAVIRGKSVARQGVETA
jgi:hypothetical protein